MILAKTETGKEPVVSITAALARGFDNKIVVRR
jgi:hypothetical protein